MDAVDFPQLLESWGVGAYSGNFAAEEVTVESLCFLDLKAIEALIPTKGPRALFIHHLEKFKTKVNNNEPSGIQPKKRKVDQGQLSQVLSKPNINELHATLKKSVPGVLVLSFYDAHEYLDDYSRDLLSQQTIFKELEGDYNIKLDRERFNVLADLIIQIFPSESKESWYDIVPKGKSTVIQGRLRHKYYSLRRSLTRAQLIPKRKLSDDTGEEEEEDHLESDLGPDADDEDFQWLLVNSQPWHEVLLKWEATYQRRLSHLANCQQNLDYIRMFPALQFRLGWELVAKDGLKQQPLLESFQNLWESYCRFLLTIIRQSKPNFLLDPKISDDQKFVEVVLQLPHLFKVRAVPKSPSASKSSKCWRPSRTEVTNALLLHVLTIPEIQEKLQQRQKVLELYKFPLQPVPVVLGPTDNIRQSFIVLGDQRWEVEGPIQAFIGAFCMCFGLNSSYAIEARHILVFLQRTLLKIETSSDFQSDRGLKTFISSRVKDFELFTANNK